MKTTRLAQLHIQRYYFICLCSISLCSSLTIFAKRRLRLCGPQQCTVVFSAKSCDSILTNPSSYPHPPATTTFSTTTPQPPTSSLDLTRYHQVGVVRYMYGNMLARQAKFLHTLVLPVVDVDRQLYLLGKQN